MTDYKLGKASEELDVDTKHYCHDYMCTHMINEWREMWLLRDGYQHVWTDGGERADAYKDGHYKGGRERLKLVNSPGYKIPSLRRK